MLFLCSHVLPFQSALFAGNKARMPTFSADSIEADISAYDATMNSFVRKLQMIPRSFTASVNSAAFRITTCLALTLFQALRFSTPPTPSTAPLPWDVAKKFQLMLEACFSADISINLAMNLFLNWLLGPSLHRWMLLPWTA